MYQEQHNFGKKLKWYCKNPEKQGFCATLSEKMFLWKMTEKSHKFYLLLKISLKI